ncbi:MAG: nucleotide exchange factor GrpE [Steroidobacteraceae bacterium]
MNATDAERPDSPAEQESPAGEPETEATLAEAEARAEQNRADFLRAIAELENFRKRAAREIESARQFGVERFAADLLPVADTLALALETAASVDAATLIEGQQATLRLLHKAFERAGLTELDPVGQAFDPAQHEAMAMRDSVEHPPHTVLQVVQKGWLLNGRLLRPARVIVSAAPEDARPPSDG